MVFESYCVTHSTLGHLDKLRYILGDFNYPKIDRSLFTSTDSSDLEVLNLISDFDPKPFDDTATHVKGDTSDLILTNRDSLS